MFKKLLSTVLSAATVIGTIPNIPAKAEEPELYPYTLFAGSSEDGAITINSDNVCINGSIATNGTVSTTAQNFNVNGTRAENAQEEMQLFFNKIDSRYFSSYVETYFEDYFLEDTNINVNIPIAAEGDISLAGNINITTGIKALNDIVLSGNVENTQQSVICAQTGDITINTDNVNLNGLVYAPNGCVNITAQNLNINSVIIIADKISITCPNLNANYNQQMAEFIGIEPATDVDLELVAFGNYNEEETCFDIYWNTTVPEGNFDIQASDDGIDYTSIGFVTNKNTFSYSFSEPFEQKYIKVVETTNYNETCESVPFLLLCNDEGYYTEFLDSDNDVLPDVYELKLGTDTYDQDTDDDGLTDYQEYVFTQTDPLVYDSVTEGIPDSEADSDEDGLSNIDELTRGTYPWTADSDDDGLSDYDEIYTYNTDPLDADSDGDGIDDDSEIKLGLDPNNTSTNGVPDSEYVIPQSIEADSSILSSINTAENPYQLSIDIETNGDAEKELKVSESSCSSAIENDAMIGASIDVDITDTCEPENIILRYNIKEEYTENTLGTFASLDELSGIKRLNVFRFDEEQGMLLPIETEFDVENNQLYAEAEKSGTYCLMDMEIWLANLGVEMPPEESSVPHVPAPMAAPKLSSGNESEWEPDYVNAPVDLVFILQTAGTDEDAFRKQKLLIEAFCTYVYKNNIDVNTYIITYDNSENNSRYPYIDGKRIDTLYGIKQTLDKKNYIDNVYVYCDCSYPFKVLEKEIQIRENADVYIYQFANGNAKPYTLYLNSHVISSVEEGKYKAYSEIFAKNWHYEYTNDQNYFSKRINENEDLFIDINKATPAVVIEHFKGKQSPERPVYDIFLPTKWKKIVLNDKLSPDNGVDTDGDSLTDWDEVDTIRLIWRADGSFSLPEIKLSYILRDVSRFNSPEFQALLSNGKTIRYIPVISDPSMSDSDGDDLTDEEELYSNTMMFCADTDGDGLSDGEEVDLWFDPTNANYDGDSYDDKEELENDTSPFVYDLNLKESAKAWGAGVLLGDFDVAENTPTLLGQITGSFIPFIDARDLIANIKNTEFKAAIFNIIGLGLDIFTGPGGSAFDVSKAFSKLGRYVTKYSDDAPKVVQAITKSAEYFPEAEKVVPDLVKVLPAGALDDLADSVKSGKKLTQKEYDKLLDICKASGKNTDEIVEATKFKSFRQLKKYLGDPGSGKQWHHIVEQCQAKSTRSGFDISEINKVSNVKATPKEVHKEISRFYSSYNPIAGNNRTVRDWLNGQSYEKQYEFGMDIWEKEMKKAGYSIE